MLGWIKTASITMDGTPRVNSSLPEKRQHRFISGRCIYIDNEPYLTRYYLWGNGSGKGLEVYFHFLHKPDQERWLHNHPWKWFFSIVLKGHYIQSVIEPHSTHPERRIERIRFFNFFRNTERYHSISEVAKGGTWTLVIVPPKTQSQQPWGYWNEETKTHEPDDGLPNPNTETVKFGPKHLYD